jgi:hypothetical protein
VIGQATRRPTSTLKTSVIGVYTAKDSLASRVPQVTKSPGDAINQYRRPVEIARQLSVGRKPVGARLSGLGKSPSVARFTAPTPSDGRNNRAS